MICTSGDLKKVKNKNKLKTYAKCDKPTTKIPSSKSTSMLQKGYVEVEKGESEGI